MREFSDLDEWFQIMWGHSMCYINSIAIIMPFNITAIVNKCKLWHPSAYPINTLHSLICLYTDSIYLILKNPKTSIWNKSVSVFTWIVVKQVNKWLIQF